MRCVIFSQRLLRLCRTLRCAHHARCPPSGRGDAFHNVFGAPRFFSEMIISGKWWGVTNGVFLYHASTQAVRRVAHDPSNPGFWAVNYVCPLRGHLEHSPSTLLTAVWC